MASIDSVRYKIVRAEMHVREFQTEIERYIKAKPDILVMYEKEAPDSFIGRISARSDIPARFPLILGDFFQNLRSALDYLVWELVLAANNNPTKDNMFPICSTPDAFEAQLGRNRLQGVSPDAIAEIRSLQPYHLGQDFDKSVLFVVDDLCNINKHRRVLLVKHHGGSIPLDEFQIITVGGQTMAQVDFSRLDKNANIGSFAIVDGAKVQMDSQIVTFIAFGEGSVKNMEITHIMVGMLEVFRDEVMPRFEKFFV